MIIVWIVQKGGSKTILELFFNRREPNFSQNISVYIDFDGASLILVLPPPPLKKKKRMG